MSNKRNFRFLSVFTGLGGLDLGLEYAGFNCIGCIEKDEFARSSIQHNSKWQIVGSDSSEAVKLLTPRKLGLKKRELDLLAAAPPCQPFSKASLWAKGERGMADPRSSCLLDLLELIRSFLPKVVVLENVAGFAKGSHNALGLIQMKLDEINRRNRARYRLSSHILDTSDFGVPQRRVRAIMVACRDGEEFEVQSPMLLNSPITAWDAIYDIPLSESEKPELRSWQKLLPSIPEGKNYNWHTSKGGGMPLFGYRTRFWSFLLKLSPSEPSWTISANPGPFTGPFHWDNRPLTVRELMRLQSFPDHWEVCGGIRDQIRQVGNATPPLFAELIGRSVLSRVFGVKFRGRPKLEISKALTPPITTYTTKVPKEFLKYVGDWPSHPGTGKGPGVNKKQTIDDQEDYKKGHT